jgi:hypothetical protein
MKDWININSELPNPYKSVLLRDLDELVVLDQYGKPCVFYRVYDCGEDYFYDERGNIYDIYEFKLWRYKDEI